MLSEATSAPPLDFELATVPPRELELDEHQLRVVGWREGEALVAAAAGSGKTSVLTERCAALVQDGCPPEAVLTLVYNKSAADSLRARLRKRLGPTFGPRALAFTFHGWAYRLLHYWGVDGVRRIVGTDDGPSSLQLARAVMTELGMYGWDARDLVKASELAREALIKLDAGDALAAIRKLPIPLTEREAGDVLAFARGYQREKARHECIDFADMLAMVCAEIDAGGERAELLRIRYAHVQVDEAQDAAASRMKIAAFLGEEARSLVWVGDFRQTIYSFSGARPDLLKSRLTEHGAELLTLPVNRRSTAVIVEAGNKISAGKDWNVGGACSPARTGEAEELRLFWTESPMDEAEAVVNEVQARIAAGVQLAEDGRASYACLLRTNAQATALECAFMARSIPCRVLGVAGGVWGSSPGREVLAYLRAAAGQADKDLVRVANKPKRYLKRATVEAALQAGTGFIQALRASKDRNAARLAQELEWLGETPWEKRVDRVLQFLLMDLQERGEGLAEPDEDRADMYKALGAAAKSLGSLEAVDAQIAKMKKVKDRDPAVEISTIHRAKGAEWHTVFTCGLAQGVMPHKKARDLEEERRLFYVAVTRAKAVAVLSAGGKPSPFMLEFGRPPSAEPAPRL